MMIAVITSNARYYLSPVMGGVIGMMGIYFFCFQSDERLFLFDFC